MGRKAFYANALHGVYEKEHGMGGHSLCIHSSFALVARLHQLLALSTGVGCCLGDLNFITVDLLPGVASRQRWRGLSGSWGRGRAARGLQAKQIEIEVCADWF